jgi:hypothetical protein
MKKLQSFFVVWLFWCSTLHLFAQGIPTICSSSGPEPSETCQTACVSCGGLNGYTGTTAGWLADPPPPGWCSQIQNDQWLAFVAGAAGGTITVTPSNCSNGYGFQMALYEDCNSNPIACNAGCSDCGTTPLSLSVSFTVGKTYYLVIDGFSQDQCDISISTLPASAFLPPSLGLVGNISGASSMCPGGTTTYSIPATTGAGYYTWSSNNPGVLFNGIPGPVDFPAPGGRVVEVTFPANASGSLVTIGVQPSNACNTGTQKFRTVNVQGILPTILPPVKVCSEDSPYYLPWGDEAPGTGTYSYIYTSVNGCDSVVMQSVISLLPIITNRTVYLCQGETAAVCDTTFGTIGFHERVCQSIEGCDSTVRITLLYMNPVAQITGNTFIGCEMNSITLESAPSPDFPTFSIKTWTRPDGTQFTGSTLPNVTEPGMYILRTRQSVGPKVCEVFDTVMVTRDSLFIPVATTSGFLGCTNSPSSVTLSANTAVASPVYAWSGPNGFSSSVQSPEVAVLGTYTVTVTTAAGCSGTATAAVTPGVGQPTVSITGGGILTCSNTSVSISATSTSPGLSYLWSGPAGFSSSEPNLAVTTAGMYVVTVTDSVGCYNSATITVLSNTTLPPLTGIDVFSTLCSLPYTLVPLGVTPNFLYSWVGPNGQSFNTREITTSIPGTYTVTVTNPVNGCTKTATVTADPLIVPEITETITLPTTGNSDGGIQISLNLPAGTYNHNWSQNGINLPGGTPLSLTGIGPGTYTLTVYTAVGCIATETYVLTSIITSGIVICPNDVYSPAESCTEVTCAPCDLNGFQGSSANFAANLPPNGFCSQIQNDLWHAFVAGSDSMTITITTSNCVSGEGIQFAVYPSACDGVPIACNPGCEGCQGSTSVTLTNAVPGALYYLVIDGYAQDECDYVISASPAHALSGGITPVASPSGISGPAAVCAGSTQTYTVPAVNNATHYIWSAPSGVLLNGQTAPVTTTTPAVTVTTLSGVTDTAQLCVKATNACQTSAETCLEIRAYTPVMQVFPGVTVCAANLPYTLPWGVAVSSSGTYSDTLTSVYGCDSILIVTVSVLEPFAEITGNSLIGCGMSSLMLGSNTAPGSAIQWYVNGVAAGDGSEVSVSLPGSVLLVASLEQGNTTCTASDTITIQADNMVLVVSATGGVVGCGTDTVSLSTTVASGNVSGLQYAWSGPDNFTSSEASPTVSLAGAYTVTVTDVLNGCSGVASALVIASAPPVIEVLGPPVLTCLQTQVVLLPNPDPALSYQWIGPNGFQSSDPAPVVSAPGVYAVTATNAYGCTATRTIIVSQNIASPQPVVAQLTQACVGVVELSAFAGIPNPEYRWTDPLGTTTQGPTVTVTMSGVYTLTVTNLDNGCSSVEAVSVVHNTNPTPIMVTATVTNPANNNGSIVVLISGGTAPYTVEWTLNGAPFSNQASLFNLGPGNYVLTVTDALGCTEIAAFNLTPVSTHDPAVAALFTVQPNPNKGLFYLNNEDNARPVERLMVYDAIGRQVWFQTALPAGNKYLIDLSNQASGVYLLEITLVNGQRIIKKVVVE